VYGNDNTPEQLEEFKERYLSGYYTSYTEKRVSKTCAGLFGIRAVEWKSGSMG
jgi:hypothetical protein